MLYCPAFIFICRKELFLQVQVSIALSLIADLKNANTKELFCARQLEFLILTYSTHEQMWLCLETQNTSDFISISRLNIKMHNWYKQFFYPNTSSTNYRFVLFINTKIHACKKINYFVTIKAICNYKVDTLEVNSHFNVFLTPKPLIICIVLAFCSLKMPRCEKFKKFKGW